MSVTSDSWEDKVGRPLLGVMLCGGKGSAFEKAVDTSGDRKTAAYIAQELLKVIEARGPKLVVQVGLIVLSV